MLLPVLVLVLGLGLVLVLARVLVPLVATMQRRHG